MKPLFFLLFAAFAPLDALCQIVFPQEPQWRIPLYFMDGTGKRDTVWFGSDPDAQYDLFDPYIDTLFGEKLVPIPELSLDSTMVAAFWGHGDFVSKVNIAQASQTNQVNFGVGTYYPIEIYNYTCPLYFWVDPADMRTGSPPFFVPNNNDTLPRFYFDCYINNLTYFRFGLDFLHVLGPHVDVRLMEGYEYYNFDCNDAGWPNWTTIGELSFWQYYLSLIHISEPTRPY